MGTWGHKVFENDMALDFLLDVEKGGVRVLKADLELYLNTVRSGELDEADAPICAALVSIVASAHGSPAKHADVTKILGARPLLILGTVGNAIKKKILLSDVRELADALIQYSNSNALGELGADDEFIASYRTEISDLHSAILEFQG
jgi:hypothetical protein